MWWLNKKAGSLVMAAVLEYANGTSIVNVRHCIEYTCNWYTANYTLSMLIIKLHVEARYAILKIICMYRYEHVWVWAPAVEWTNPIYFPCFGQNLLVWYEPPQYWKIVDFIGTVRSCNTSLPCENPMFIIVCHCGHILLGVSVRFHNSSQSAKCDSIACVQHRSISIHGWGQCNEKAVQMHDEWWMSILQLQTNSVWLQAVPSHATYRIAEP